MTQVIESGGVVLYALDLDEAEALAQLLRDSGDRGFIEDAEEIDVRLERVQTLQALARLGDDARLPLARLLHA